MDKKRVVVLATGVVATLGAVQAMADSSALAATSAPPIHTVSSTGAGDYVVNSFTFTRSTGVAVDYSTVLAGGGSAGDTAGVHATHTTKGNRSFAGFVGVLSTAPKACTNAGATPIAAAAVTTGMTSCTY